MGVSMFQVKKGLSLDGAVQVMSGAGAPGAAGDASLAPVGSMYLDATNGQMYVKKNSGVGTDKWLRSQDSSDMAAAMQGISWREPVKVRDVTSYADLAAAETAVNTGTVDGTAVVANDRILFDGITGEGQNVFIVTGTPGSGATLVEDANTLTKGDTLYVNSGTDAGKTFNYNGTIWVQQGGASSTEIGFVRNYIGKIADGNEMPEYFSGNIVQTGDSLTESIAVLDDKIGVVPGTPTFIDGDFNISYNLKILDSQVGMARTYLNVYVPATTQTVVDSMAATSNDYCMALEWTVVVKLISDTTRLWAGKVFAVQNGTAVDFNISSVLGLGTAIPGLDFSVEISGGNIQLLATATNEVRAYITRHMVGDVNT
ncbi:MAG: hypothetical protein HQL90_14325 [Magnetococcales bacterium]|nr:hypothetical protein [Magnetococcales bacterium]